MYLFLDTFTPRRSHSRVQSAVKDFASHVPCKFIKRPTITQNIPFSWTIPKLNLRIHEYNKQSSRKRQSDQSYFVTTPELFQKFTKLLVFTCICIFQILTFDLKSTEEKKLYLFPKQNNTRFLNKLKKKPTNNAMQCNTIPISILRQA